REIANGLREVQSVQRKIGLRELPLPEPRSKRIHRIVAARDVFSKGQLRKEGRSSQRCRGFRILIASLRNGSVRALAQGPLDRLPERKRLLGVGGQPSKEGKKRNPWDSICAEIHSADCPRGVHSQEQSHEMTHPLQELHKTFSRQPFSI